MYIFALEGTKMENNTYDPIIDGGNSTTPVGNDKLFAILAYIGILWIIGLVATPEKDHAFVKNHVNNAIILCIGGVVLACIPFLGWLVEIAIFVFAIMGIVKAAQGEMFTIPVIGEKFQIIK